MSETAFITRGCCVLTPAGRGPAFVNRTPSRGFGPGGLQSLSVGSPGTAHLAPCQPQPGTVETTVPLFLRSHADVEAAPRSVSVVLTVSGTVVKSSSD